MKILFYSTYFTSHKGGIEKFICTLANWLITRGHEVGVITEDQEGSAVYPLSEKCTLMRCQLRKREAEYAAEFRYTIESYKPDIIVFCSPSHTLIRKALQTLKGLDIHFVISEHGPPRIIEEHHTKIQRLINCANADGLHVLLPEFSKNLAAIDKSKIIDIAHVIEKPMNFAQPDKAFNGRYQIINVARLDLYQKQQDHLIKAFIKLAPNFPNWDLRLVGSVWNKKDLKIIETLINESGFANRIILSGASDQVNEELVKSHLFAFPSLFEGFGLALTEAQAIGLPCIGYDTCEGVNSLINHNKDGILASGEQGVNALSESLATLMNNAKLRKLYGERAQHISEVNSQENIFGRWEMYLRTIITRPHQLMEYTSGEQALATLTKSNILLDVIFDNIDDLKKLHGRTE